MATIVLSAVGAAAGASIGGGVMGLSSMVIGRAVGAAVGRSIDARLAGAGSAPVKTGRVDRFRLTGAGDGAPIAQVYGRMRVGGQVIWASRFVEHVQKSGGGGKGAPRRPRTKTFSYSVSLAVALCEGVIADVGRIWADGREISVSDLNLRVYRGTEDQMPDPKIEAVEGPGMTPAYRGIAYVVLEDLDLGPFGNRVPQFSFEVFRPAQVAAGATATDPANGVQGVALIPGTGEYALATTPVYLQWAKGKVSASNMNSPSGMTDLATSLAALDAEAPNCRSVSLVVSWFGDDLRCDRATLRPKVEQTAVDGTGMAWRVSGLTRAQAQTVPQLNGLPVYGGTPADQSVIEAIAALKARGKQVMFYPFILMEQLAGNGMTDPWTGAPEQPALPWRGRITTSLAPGQAGSPDTTAAADAEVAAFFGTAAPGDFAPVANGVDYNGPAEWSYRRFILHYAHLCAAAGGVDAFCLGSEMRGLTQVRGAAGFPAVDALRQLAADVRAILGPTCKIGYAADWSEYFGYHPQDGSGDVYFHLDPLWSDPEIDFVGIDNYMPLADWRDGGDHADAAWGAIYDTDYLKANIEGGEGFDWYYPDDNARDYQLRAPITDGAHGEDWVFRYKDIRAWWSNPHHERIGGVRQATPTGWVPQSKPIWFTEFGCAAVDKGANQPNKFVDANSSESGLPHYSTGRRDELMQAQYFRAMLEYWSDPAKNPVSGVYGGPMVDLAHSHAWAWDARPYPHFPLTKDKWSDAPNYFRGHWLNGRLSARALADVVSEICGRSGARAIDTSRLWGLVRGYVVDEVDTARAALQPLMLAYGVDAMEREGRLEFRSRAGVAPVPLAADALAWPESAPSPVARERATAEDAAGRVRLTYIDADSDYEPRADEALFGDDAGGPVSGSEAALLMTRAEARAVAERWLAEARTGRDGLKVALPRSKLSLGAGDVIDWDEGGETARYRIDRVTLGQEQLLEAVRVEPSAIEPSDAADAPGAPRPFAPPVPVWPVFMDLPLMTGAEVPHAPHVAALADPWPGSVAVFGAAQDSGYQLNTLISQSATMGTTLTALPAATAGMIDRGAPLRVQLAAGALASAPLDAVLNGANLAAIGDGSAANWELFQFTDAVLVGPDTWEISGRLRGQAGTDALPSNDWPAGSLFVLLDGAAEQIALAEADRGLARHWRIGPAARSHDDPSYQHFVQAFDGIGLRPLAPVHLRAARSASGDLAVSWVRRTRIDGDSWQSVEVPLGEESESYLVRVSIGGAILREATVITPVWTYTAADQAADAVAAPFDIEVAQVSTRFGPGLFRKVTING